MAEPFANRVERAWAEPLGLLWIFLPLEWLFAAISSLRRAAFRRGIFASTHPGKPVVVIGNISVGGTGKTPTVIAVANALCERGYRVGVVSRGYGGKARLPERVNAEQSTAERVGDEALLIAQRTNATVMVGRDRAAVAMALAPSVDVIISDDGLQHYGLRRDIEVITLDAQQGFGNGHLLPLGPLREPRRRLATADFLLQRNGRDPNTATAYTPDHFKHVHRDERRELRDPGFGPAVHALAAIARPARFFNTLGDLGLRPTHHPFADHYVITPARFAQLRDRPCIITAKDAVKCCGSDYAEAHPEVWALEMRLSLPDGFIPALLEQLHSKGLEPACALCASRSASTSTSATLGSPPAAGPLSSPRPLSAPGPQSGPSSQDRVS